MSISALWQAWTQADKLQRWYSGSQHPPAYTEDPAEFAARDPLAPHHRIEINFEDRGASSWVKFSQYGELPDGEVAQAQAGIESYFVN